MIELIGSIYKITFAIVTSFEKNELSRIQLRGSNDRWYILLTADGNTHISQYNNETDARKAFSNLREMNPDIPYL